MSSRVLAILLAVLALDLAALDASAQPRGWGGGRGGGFGRMGGGFGRMGGFGGRMGGGFRRGGGGFAPGARFAPGGGYGFAPPQVGGRGWGGPGGWGGGGAYGMGAGAPGWRGGEQDMARNAVRAGRNIPLGQAIQAVRRRAPGRELDAGLEPGPNGRPVYRLRWAGQDGRRQDYMVDAGTGQVLGVQGGP